MWWFHIVHSENRHHLTTISPVCPGIHPSILPPFLPSFNHSIDSSITPSSIQPSFHPSVFASFHSPILPTTAVLPHRPATVISPPSHHHLSHHPPFHTYCQEVCSPPPPSQFSPVRQPREHSSEKWLHRRPLLVAISGMAICFPICPSGCGGGSVPRSVSPDILVACSGPSGNKLIRSGFCSGSL